MLAQFPVFARWVDDSVDEVFRYTCICIGLVYKLILTEIM